MDALYESLEKQLNKIPQWAKSIDKFQELEIDDQVNLLRASNLKKILSLNPRETNVLFLYPVLKIGVKFYVALLAIAQFLSTAHLCWQMAAYLVQIVAQMRTSSL